MPRGPKDGLLWGIQLWANLPSSHKMMDPRATEAVTSNQIPQVVTNSGASVKIICGQFNGEQGPVQDIVTDPEYLDITLPAKSQFKHPVGKGRTVMAYVFEGAGYFDSGHEPRGIDRKYPKLFKKPPKATYDR